MSRILRAHRVARSTVGYHRQLVENTIVEQVYRLKPGR